MVNCSTLLLASSIFLGLAARTQAPDVGRIQQSEPNANSKSRLEETLNPIHRVVLIVDPLKGISDPLVLALYNRSLEHKSERKRQRSLPRPKLPGDTNPIPTITMPNNLLSNPGKDPAETITAEQLTALAELYLVGSVRDKLVSSFRIMVLDAKEVESAINELHLSRSQVRESDGASKLCSRLDCDAVIVIGAPTLTRREGSFRELVLRTTVRLAAVREHNIGFVPAHKPEAGAYKIGAAHAQINVIVTGAAVSNRSFLNAGFSSSYADLSQQAAAQAAAIALHSLSTSEQAPFMSAETKVAVAPSYGPNRADLLVLDRVGRYTESGAVNPLPADVSAYFKPELMPLPDVNVVDAKSVATAMQELSVSGNALWRENGKPDDETVRRLARKLGVQYILLTHVTDVEVLAAPSEKGETPKSAEVTPEPTSDADVWERQAHAEVCGVLVRGQDGAVVWTDRGDTTVTSRVKVDLRNRGTANRRIAMDAEKFALIDLQRRFAAFRSQFEQ